MKLDEPARNFGYQYAGSSEFLSLALAAEVDVLVSSDQDLLVMHPGRGTTTATPAEFSGRSRPADGHRRLLHSHRSTAGRRCQCITIWKQFPPSPSPHEDSLCPPLQQKTSEPTPHSNLIRSDARRRSYLSRRDRQLSRELGHFRFAHRDIGTQKRASRGRCMLIGAKSPRHSSGTLERAAIPSGLAAIRTTGLPR